MPVQRHRPDEALFLSVLYGKVNAGRQRHFEAAGGLIEGTHDGVLVIQPRNDAFRRRGLENEEKTARRSRGSVPGAALGARILEKFEVGAENIHGSDPQRAGTAGPQLRCHPSRLTIGDRSFQIAELAAEGVR